MAEGNGLSLEEKATNYETFRHIEKVQSFIHMVIRDLLDRAEKHDQTKLDHPEVEYFVEYTPKLDNVTYGSPEYEQLRKALQPALEHHYAHARHHPEHWKHGINDMTLLDLIEMLCDWKASSTRH